MEGQEVKNTQERHKQLINKFLRLDKPTLKEFEEKNRDEIQSYPLPVAIQFESKWKKMFGESYYPHFTSREVVESRVSKSTVAGRIDPKSCNYRSDEPFTKIMWSKRVIQHRFGDRMVKPMNQFDIHGIHAETGDRELIFRGLYEEQLEIYLGEEVAEKIKKKAGGIDVAEANGEIEGDFVYPVIGYWEVIFHPQVNPHDPKDVVLPVEGQCLQIERDKPVIVPGNFLEAADHGVYSVYRQRPGEPQKVIGHVRHFPYTPMRKATKQEYLEMLQAGNKAVREKRERQEAALRG